LPTVAPIFRPTYPIRVTAFPAVPRPSSTFFSVFFAGVRVDSGIGSSIILEALDRMLRSPILSCSLRPGDFPSLDLEILACQVFSSLFLFSRLARIEL